MSPNNTKVTNLPLYDLLGVEKSLFFFTSFFHTKSYLLITFSLHSLLRFSIVKSRFCKF